MKGFTKIGITTKVQGLKGKVGFDIEPSFLPVVQEEKVVFLFTDGQLVPFFIDHLSNSDDPIIGFESIKSPEQASKIAGSDLFMPSDKLPTLDPMELGLELLENYELWDESMGKIGIIHTIEEFPNQLMAFIEYKEADIMIPIVRDWVVDLNPDSKTIHMKLPDGILSL